MAIRFGIPQFPGSCDEVDTLLACSRVGDAELLWHKDADLKGADVIVIPGGFSYGDYLRAGAIPPFSPVMGAVKEFAADGGLVLGICNGFQVLTEAGLLPGALLPNVNLAFTCRQVELIVENNETPFTHECAPTERLSVPAKHTSGRYWAPTELLNQLEAEGQVILRYAEGDNFNGSVNDIAGVTNEGRNVFGLMPHPEHAVDPLTGSADGLKLFSSLASAAAVSGAPA
jgi:phosphoribosylformylglycinamidine synthase